MYTFLKEVEKIIDGKRTVEVYEYKVYDFDGAKTPAKGNLTELYNCLNQGEVAKPVELNKSQ